jgi:chemotaxis protein methyltransferase CheR
VRRGDSRRKSIRKVSRVYCRREGDDVQPEKLENVEIMPSYDLRPIDFDRISKLVYEHCGINLHDGKKELVKARLGKRLREGDFSSFAEYYQFVTTDEGTDELIAMIDSISTNLTYFFREESHFAKLREVLTDHSAMRVGERPSLFTIWSAGCSTGEEPYSLAMTFKECLNGSARLQVVATDISTRVLKKAGSGIYTKESLKNIPPLLLKKYFQVGFGRWIGTYRVKKDLRDTVEFRRFNLIEQPPAEFIFDVIFCRNVMIYFDKLTQGTLVSRFYNCLKKGGYFFIGHSESLTGLNHAFKYVEPSVYRK